VVGANISDCPGPHGAACHCREPEVRFYCLTHAKREADRLFSLEVRKGGRCEACGATTNLQCSHFISRRYLGVRYVRLNAECLCFRCHKRLTERPLEAEERGRRVLGSAVYDELRRTALTFKGRPDYAAVIGEMGR